MCRKQTTPEINKRLVPVMMMRERGTETRIFEPHPVELEPDDSLTVWYEFEEDSE